MRRKSERLQIKARKKRIVDGRVRCHRIVLELFDRVYKRRCFNCKHTGPYCHFDWAHWRRDDKVANISHLIYRCDERRLREELPKCRVLCKHCHAEETARENNWRFAFY